MKNIKFSYLLLLGLIFVLVGCGQDQSVEGSGSRNDAENNGNVTLTVASFIPENSEVVKDIIPMWIEKIESETYINIEFIGGPESIPADEQFNSMQNGVHDISFIASSFYGHIMPEASSLYMSPYTPEEERNNGYFDYINDRFNNHGIEYLGRFIGNAPFYFWSNNKIETLDDLNGLKFRSNATYHEILDVLGVTPVDIVPGEVYTSLERNMVDGFGFLLIGPYEDGWTEVTKYLIDEPFLNQNATILISKDAFSSLDEGTQQLLKELTAEFEQEMLSYFEDKSEEALSNILEQGVEIINLLEEDSIRFQEIVDEVYWEKLENDVPDQVEKIKEIFEVN